MPDRLELGRVIGQGVDELDDGHAQSREHRQHEGVDEEDRADGGHRSGHVVTAGQAHQGADGDDQCEGEEGGPDQVARAVDTDATDDEGGDGDRDGLALKSTSGCGLVSSGGCTGVTHGRILPRGGGRPAAPAPCTARSVGGRGEPSCARGVGTIREANRPMEKAGEDLMGAGDPATSPAGSQGSSAPLPSRVDLTRPARVPLRGRRPPDRSRPTHARDWSFTAGGRPARDRRRRRTRRVDCAARRGRPPARAPSSRAGSRFASRPPVPQAPRAPRRAGRR